MKAHFNNAKGSHWEFSPAKFASLTQMPLPTPIRYLLWMNELRGDWQSSTPSPAFAFENVCFEGAQREKSKQEGKASGEKRFLPPLRHQQRQINQQQAKKCGETEK